MRRTFRWALAVLLLGLLVLTGVGLFLTGAPAVLTGTGGNRAQAKAAASLVDEIPLKTARNLAALPTTAAERPYRRQALSLADHEVDLAFSQALRQASEHPAPPTARTLRLEQAVKEAQARVDADRKAAAELTRRAGRAREPAKGQLLQRLQVVEAELALDKDELKDVRKALLTAGGGEEAQLQQLLDQHEDSESHALAHDEEKEEKSEEARVPVPMNPVAPTPTPARRSLLAWLTGWTGLLHKQGLILQAQSAALANAAEFGRKHDALERTIQSDRAKIKTGARVKSASVASTLSSMRRLGEEQQDLVSYQERTGTERALARVYGRWLGVVKTEARAALHRLIRAVFWILVVLFLAVVSDLVVTRLFSRFSFDRKRLHTVHSVLHFATRAIAAILILIVIFGPPRQLGTILGLVGAGLAVALKDFIVAFLGWFRLIGPNGMRPGDWVEINGAQQITGVQGKVLEVGLLFTVILEAGNWTDAGHPTGRRVAFMNSFAIEGYYFNFTTAGQWLWDEIQFGLPAGRNPYPLLDSLQKTAEKETSGNGKIAEQDWERAMSGSGLAPFSAKPVITVRPTEGGLSVVIRYIARADEREDVRQRLYHAAFDMLRDEKALAPSTPSGGPRPEPA